MFSKKGLMAKKQRDKMEFWKGRQKQKKQDRKKRNTLRQAFCGNKIDKKPLKLQENSLFGPFYKTQEPKHRQQKTKPPKSKKKNIPKKDLFAFWQTTSIFGKFLFLFKLHSFMSTKLCFAESTIKIVFSAEHSF